MIMKSSFVIIMFSQNFIYNLLNKAENSVLHRNVKIFLNFTRDATK